jgi:hypothetical protein
LGALMRHFRSLTPVALAALGGLAAGACGLADVFRPAGLKNVVVRYVGDTLLRVGMRVAPAVTVEADGAPVPNPRLVFSSSNTLVLALTPVGDTLAACRVGGVLLTVRFISSMVTDSAPTAQDSIHVQGGSPLPTCP